MTIKPVTGCEECDLQVEYHGAAAEACVECRCQAVADEIQAEIWGEIETEEKTMENKTMTESDLITALEIARLALIGVNLTELDMTDRYPTEDLAGLRRKLGVVLDDDYPVVLDEQLPRHIVRQGFREIEETSVGTWNANFRVMVAAEAKQACDWIDGVVEGEGVTDPGTSVKYSLAAKNLIKQLMIYAENGNQ